MGEKNSQIYRLIYLDFLRVISILAVLIIHVAGEKITECDVNSAEWMTMNVYDSVSRWGVSVFIMISGALFLSKKHCQ